MLLPSFTLFFLILTTCNSLDTLVVNQKISDGETIVSGNQLFELGFFSPGSSNNRYLGIWYKNTSPLTTAWVANRIKPVNNTLGIVKFDSQGILSIVDDGGTIIWWSSNSLLKKSSVSSASANPVAQLMACKNNCSCTAYANPNVTPGGVGCLLWFGELTDVRVYPQNGQDLYIRLAASELQALHSNPHGTKRVVITVTLLISAGLILLGLILAVYTWSKRKNKSDVERSGKEYQSKLL